MAGDPNYAYRVLGLHCNEANGSTTVTDKSPTPKTITVRGSAAIATDSGAIGGVSLYVGGTGAAVDTPGVSAFALGTGDFSVSLFLKTTDTTAGLVDFYTSGQPTWQVYLEVGKIAWYFGATRILLSPSAVNDGTRRHIELCRSGTTLRLFVAGALVASATDSNNYSYISAYLSVGRQYTGSPSATSDLVGNINEVLIYKGVALHTAAFTPNSTAFGDGMGYVEGVVRDDANAPCARTVRLYRRDTGALVASGASDATTGVYSLPVPSLEDVQRIVLDDSGGALYNDIIDRVIPA